MDAQVAYGFHNLQNEKPYPAQGRIANKKGFVKAKLDDGLLEVFGFKQGWHASLVMVDLCSAKHISQYNNIIVHQRALSRTDVNSRRYTSASVELLADMPKQRKMGHITVVGPSLGIVQAQVKSFLKEGSAEGILARDIGRDEQKEMDQFEVKRGSLAGVKTRVESASNDIAAYLVCTSNQNSKSILEGHVSALKELLKEPSNRDLIKPMLLDFDIQDVSDEEIEDGPKGKAKIGDEDLSKPFKKVLKCPFTRRIVEFSSPGEWPMPVWCRMFQQTLDGKARAWFDKLPPGSIDNCGSLQEKFLNRFGMLKACDKDPTEISKIVRKANETLFHFKERWVSESNAIPNVPELMQISSFMSSHKCPELAKRFFDNVPRTRKDAPVQWVQRNDRQQRYPYGNNRRRQEHIPAFRTPERNIPYVPPQRPNQELRLPQPAPLVGVPSKENVNKYCDYHNEKGHSMNDCFHLKQQLELALESGKLNHLRKSTMTDEKWTNVPIIFPPVLARDLSEEALVVEAEVEGYLVRRIHIGEGALVEIMFEHCFNMLHPSIRSREGKKQAVEPPKERRAQDTISSTNQVLVNPAYPEQLVIIGTGLSPEGSRQLKNLLKKNIDIFAWEPSDMTGVPKRIIKHSLNANSLEKPVSQKRRVFCSEKSRVITEEVAEWLKAGIVRPIKYPTWISNPVLVKKVDESWRMCIDFKNTNAACPKDYYPLPEIDSKIEAVMGFPLKCFLDAYKGYHQVQMAEEDEEKTAFYTDQGTYCYTKMSFGLKNAGATYQRLIDGAFQSQIGRNLEAYVDDMVIKSKFEREMLADIAETFDNLRRINMKLNPKSVRLGSRKGNSRVTWSPPKVYGLTQRKLKT
ncbi:reverse transcriptase domain-containing protein, partial [Tanacetum coccineum]